MDHSGHHGHHGAQHDVTPHPAAPAAVHDHGHGHQMKMWFHFGCEEVILFDWWRTESCVGMTFSCLLVFLMAAVYEGIKWLRVYLQSYAASRSRRAPLPAVSLHACSQPEEALLDSKPALDPAGTLKTDDVYKSTVTREAAARNRGLERLLKHLDVQSASPCSAFHLLQTLLYCVQLTLAYWLMLVAMTYSVYLTAMVVLGAGFGHWLFTIVRTVPPCAEKQDAFASDACH